MDYYQTLGISKESSPDDIKKAYRKLASQHHPDKGGNTQKFQEIQAAYDTLSDPNKRRQYDSPAPRGFTEGFPGGMHGFNFNVNGFDVNSIFDQMFRQNTGPQTRQRPVYRTQIVITLEQAYSGGEQSLRLQTPTDTRMVNITIPKGVPDGGQLRFEDLIPDATLMVEFRIHNHLRFERRGDDLTCNHPISVFDLITGTEFEFTSISGKTLAVKVPPKTQPNMYLKIAGQGMPRINSPHYGDQIILLKAFIPDIIDEDITNSILRSKEK